MTDHGQTDGKHQDTKRTVEYVHLPLGPNMPKETVRDKLLLFGPLILGHRRLPNTIIETEMQHEFKNPKLRSIQYLKHIEQNRLGRYAYTPRQIPPRGTVPTFNDKAYPEVIPRFHLPKMPF